MFKQLYGQQALKLDKADMYAPSDISCPTTEDSLSLMGTGCTEPPSLYALCSDIFFATVGDWILS